MLSKQEKASKPQHRVGCRPFLFINFIWNSKNLRVCFLCFLFFLIHAQCTSLWNYIGGFFCWLKKIMRPVVNVNAVWCLSICHQQNVNNWLCSTYTEVIFRLKDYRALVTKCVIPFRLVLIPFKQSACWPLEQTC